jgi:hypothetical protein
MITSLYRNLYSDNLSFKMNNTESVISRRKGYSTFEVVTLSNYKVIDSQLFTSFKAAIVYAKMMAAYY